MKYIITFQTENAFGTTVSHIVPTNDDSHPYLTLAINDIVEVGGLSQPICDYIITKKTIGSGTISKSDTDIEVYVDVAYILKKHVEEEPEEPWLKRVLEDAKAEKKLWPDWAKKSSHTKA